MFRFEFLQFASEVCAHLLRAFHQIHTLHFLNGSNSRCQREWMCLIGVTVCKEMIVKIRGDLCTRRTEPKRNCSVSNPLCSRQNIWNNVPVIHGEPLSCAAPAGHHFIRNE